MYSIHLPYLPMDFLDLSDDCPGLPDETRREGREGHHQQQQRHGPVTGQTKGVGHRQDACHREEPSMSGGRFLVGKICIYIYILMMIALGWEDL